MNHKMAEQYVTEQFSLMLKYLNPNHKVVSSTLMADNWHFLNR